MTGTKMDKVREYYEHNAVFEDRRLPENDFEMPVTLKFISKYVNPGEKILDIACGTGWYAKVLLEKGYLMGLNDLSKKNMDLTLQKTGEHPGIIQMDVSDALDSDIWGKGKWDAVLVLGPLYHLPDRQDRLKILLNAKRSVRKGGVIFLAFMSRIVALLYGLKNNPGGINKPDGVMKLWKTGTDESFVDGTRWFTNGYFSFPEEINPLLGEAGLKPLHLAGIEGIFAENMELYHRLDSDLQHKWMRFIIDSCEETHMVYSSKHLLSVCRKV